MAHNTTPENSLPIPVQIVNTAPQLQAMVKRLAEIKEIGIDTEFDRFNYQYGVHLQLIQIFDGHTCFLVDPLALPDLTPLWSIFENPAICKILYSGFEDVDILRRFGCKLRHIFDIQIAANLCNRVETSFAKLVAAELGVHIQKASQLSRWDTRPLTQEQLHYAANDVIHLLRLKQIIVAEVEARRLTHILGVENEALQHAKSQDYEPKLNGRQKATFNPYARTVVMQFKLLIDEYARQMNISPYLLMSESVFENIIKDKRQFMQAPFTKGMHRKLLTNTAFKNAFMKIVEGIDVTKGWEKQLKHVPAIRHEAEKVSTHFKKPDENFTAFKNFVQQKHGENAAIIMMRGMAEIFQEAVPDWSTARPFQQELYEEFLSAKK